MLCIGAGPEGLAGHPGTEDELKAWEQLPLRNVELGQGKFSIKITDRERKLNINSARPELLRHILEFHGEVASTDVDIFLDSLADWIDPDDDSRVNGAESDDYLGEIPAYYCKNGPLDHISELKMINGFKDSPEIYELFEKYFTTVSGGLVNINTASAEVIGLLPGMEPYLAGEIVNYRSSEFGPFGIWSIKHTRTRCPTGVDQRHTALFVHKKCHIRRRSDRPNRQGSAPQLPGAPPESYRAGH